MRFILTISILLSGFTAQAADVTVSPCSRNPKTLYVEINGDSAINIFRALAQRIKYTPAQMLNTISNGMDCRGLKFLADGDVAEARCSYVMMGQKNVPFPQVDPGFSREEIIECN